MNVKQYGNDSVAATRRKGDEEYTEPMDEEEEAARAPYWHVSQRATQNFFAGEGQQSNTAHSAC